MKSILENGLIPNFCKEVDVFDEDNHRGIPMVSFCDIPISLATLFNNRYGRHAIGFTKEWGERNKIAPILYSIPHSLKDFQGAPISAIAYIKPFMGTDRKGKPQCNYEENEWRYVIPNETVPWHKSTDECDKWRGDKNKKKPKPIPQFKQDRLKFEINDINFIMVEQDNQIPRIIKQINNLKFIGGTNKRLSKDDKDLLISKIISKDRINKDI